MVAINVAFRDSKSVGYGRALVRRRLPSCTIRDFLLPEPVEVPDDRFVPTHPLITKFREGWWREPCVYCGEIRPKHQMTIEHILAKSDGGTNEWDNLAPACENCNHKRGSMPMLMMLLWKSYARAGIQLSKKRRVEMGIRQPLPVAQDCTEGLTPEPEPVIILS